MAHSEDYVSLYTQHSILGLCFCPECDQPSFSGDRILQIGFNSFCLKCGLGKLEKSRRKLFRGQIFYEHTVETFRHLDKGQLMILIMTNTV